MKVENKNAHRAADKEYFFATHVRDGDGGGDDVVMLLLTDKELERWRQFCQQRMLAPPEGFLSAEAFMQRLEELAGQQNENTHNLRLLKSLYDYAASL